MKRCKTFSDGGSRGNPGPAASGAVVEDLQTGERYHLKHYLGVTTNNQAEYKGLLMALEKALDLDMDEVECNLDSELIVKQMKGEYRVKNVDLAPLFLKVHNLCTQFKKVTFRHVRREFNKAADALVNEALDSHLGR